MKFSAEGGFGGIRGGLKGGGLGGVWGGLRGVKGGFRGFKGVEGSLAGLGLGLGDQLQGVEALAFLSSVWDSRASLSGFGASLGVGFLRSA